MDTKSVLMSAFLQYAVPVLATGIMALTTWALKQVADCFKAHAQESKLAAVGGKVTTVVSAIVHDIEADEKVAYEEAAKDGVITAEEGKRLKDLAVQRIMSTLGTTGLAQLKEVMGIGASALPDFLSGLVEKHVAAIDVQPGDVVVAQVPQGGSPLAVLPGGQPSPVR